MNILDTRDLIEEREDLKSQILDSFNEEFETDFTDFEDLPTLLGDDLGEVDNEEEEQERLEDFKNTWKEELEQIQEINDLEDVVNSYAGDDCEDGVTLIDEDDFIEYTEELLVDCGYIPSDLPSWIEIDYKSTADNVKVDYSEVEFRGTTYLYR